MTDQTEKPTREDTGVVGARVAAQIIDMILMFIAFSIVLFVFALIGGAASATSGSDAVANIFTGFGFLTAAVIFLGYSFFLEAFWDGRTVGKRVVGIKVVKEDGAPIDIGSAFVRNIPAIVSLAWLSYLVALLSMAASDKRQRVFDRLAGTVVIRE